MIGNQTTPSLQDVAVRLETASPQEPERASSAWSMARVSNSVRECCQSFWHGPNNFPLYGLVNIVATSSGALVGSCYRIFTDLYSSGEEIFNSSCYGAAIGGMTGIPIYLLLRAYMEGHINYNRLAQMFRRESLGTQQEMHNPHEEGPFQIITT